MVAFASISLDDSASPTPNAVTFNPSSIDTAGVAKLYTSGSLDERKGISLSVRLPKANGAVARVTAKVTIPVTDSESPPNKVGEVIGTAEFVIPKRASDVQRADILAFLANFLADASVVGAVTSFESIY